MSSDWKKLSPHDAFLSSPATQINAGYRRRIHKKIMQMVNVNHADAQIYIIRAIKAHGHKSIITNNTIANATEIINYNNSLTT